MFEKILAGGLKTVQEPPRSYDQRRCGGRFGRQSLRAVRFEAEPRNEQEGWHKPGTTAIVFSAHAPCDCRA